MTKLVATWIDEHEARIFHIRPHKFHEIDLTAPHVHHLHPKDPEGAKRDPETTRRFFHEVARSLDGAREILLVGPWKTKLEFLRYVHKHDHALEPRIVGIETVERPTDSQLIAYAEKYFNRVDSPR